MLLKVKNIIIEVIQSFDLAVNMKDSRRIKVLVIIMSRVDFSRIAT